MGWTVEEAPLSTTQYNSTISDVWFSDTLILPVWGHVHIHAGILWILTNRFILKLAPELYIQNDNLLAPTSQKKKNQEQVWKSLQVI